MFLLISCYIADLIFADPKWFPHPVRGIGRLISFMDNRLRGTNGKWKERIKGAILVFVVVGISTCLAYLFIELSKGLSPFLGNLAWVYLGYCSLSIKDLQVKAKAIARALKKNSLARARKELSKIVGRDTGQLSKEGVTTAAIESIAENTNDGIIAPLIYLILGGPVLAFAYKSINTIDSMIGYKNERYLHFGWFAARLDDIVNFIPARICGFLIAVSSLPAMTRSFKIMFRDGRKHPSPNSGVSIAAMAGALGIRLGGPSAYHGKLVEKPYLGEKKRPIHTAFINEALNISLLSSALTVFIGTLLKWII
ncbi:adenosylcobinamide-phosphate synthase CbiB [bacterium]|nr:adenosylcobinamide-phosphate synthase CbiB [bacterium]